MRNPMNGVLSCATDILLGKPEKVEWPKYSTCPPEHLAAMPKPAWEKP